MLRGIDVSEHQGRINWNAVKPEIDYAILRIGYGDDVISQDDAQFKRNADECTRLGIPFGVYIYSYAMNVTQAKSEAEHVLRLIEGYKLDYPIYLDLEDKNTTGRCNSKLIGDMAEAFCNTIENAGYWCGIYASQNWFENILTDSRFAGRWTKWIAQYPNAVEDYNKWNNGTYAMWQYASDGRVNGVTGNVDCNVSYVDFKELINGNGDKKEEDKKVMVRGVVVYKNDAEVNMAVQLARKLGYVAMWSGTPMDYSALPQENIWAIGGDRGSYTGYLLEDHFISGANRDETAIKFAELLERL